MTTQQPQPVGRQLVGDIAPKLAQLTDEVVFADVWERPGLSPRDRSLITVASLVALYRTEQLGSHLRRALDNGVTQEELVDHPPGVLLRMAHRDDRDVGRVESQ